MEIEQYLKLYHINNTFGEIEKTQTPISKISSGEIFGDELMGHRENSQFSVKVESLDAKLISINIRIFRQTFKRVLNELKTYCTEKYQYLGNNYDNNLFR